MDGPEYYNYERGYILFDMDIPPELLANAAPKGGLKEANLEGHFKLMNHQLLRLRNALAIAQLTGRALIMPELWCGVDKYWAPLDDGGAPPLPRCSLVPAGRACWAAPGRLPSSHTPPVVLSSSRCPAPAARH